MNKLTTTEEAIKGSFLARVPALLEEGHSIDEAIDLAYKQEEAFLLEMAAGQTTRAQLAREVLAHTTYETINRRESERKLGLRLEAIAQR